MGWAKFDDRWATHPKLLAAGLEAAGLDARSICWCAGQETDGFVPDVALSILTAGHRSPGKVVARLVEVGRWSRDDERKGYVIHDYLDYNQSREAAEAKREDDRRRQASFRSRQGRTPEGRFVSQPTAGDVTDDPNVTNAVTHNVTNGRLTRESQRGHTAVTPAPTRPDPYPPPAPPGSHEPAAPSVGKIEEDRSLDEPPDPLVDRLSGLWPGRPRMLSEARAVVSRCRTVADDSVIDEAIGAMLAADDKPRSPNYLLATVRDRLVRIGAYAEGDEALDALRTGPKVPTA